MGDKLSVLPHVTAISEGWERFLVICYDTEGDTLGEAETFEASTAEDALMIGQTAVEDYAMVFVMLETHDALGVIRSSVLRVFEQP